MFLIDTSKKGWQKHMEEQMKEGESFKVLTANENLAKALEEGKLDTGALKFFLMGTGIGFTGGFTAARLAGTAGLSGITRMLSVVDPEPVTKAILAVVSAAAAAVGAYYLYRMVEMLVKGKYNFRIVQQTTDGEWVIEAEPAQAKQEKEVMPEEPQTNPA